MTTAANKTTIDASGLLFKDLNVRLRDAVAAGAEKIEIRNVYGQRYIGTNLHGAADSDARGERRGEDGPQHGEAGGVARHAARVRQGWRRRRDPA